MRIREILETTSSATTSTASVAAVPGGIGGPMMPVIRRMPAGQSFFGPAAGAPAKPKKKRTKRR